MFHHPIRLTTRLLGFAGFVVSASFSYFSMRIKGPVQAEARGIWMQRSAQHLCRVLHLEVRNHGTPPTLGLIASNHLGYTDIVAFASITPCIFVSKSEVRYWPVIGLLSTWAGTIYLNRKKKSNVAKVGQQIAAHLKDRRRVIVFPEGTSSDGSGVLPFHSSLFSPAVITKSQVTPCHLSYSEPGNRAGSRVCYWGDMLFLTHFLNLLTLDSIQATIIFGKSLPPEATRKELAKQTYDQVVELSISQLTPNSGNSTH